MEVGAAPEAATVLPLVAAVAMTMQRPQTEPKEYLRELLASIRLGRTTFLRRTARSPLEYHAELLLQSVPSIELVELTGTTTFEARVQSLADRHSWSLGVAEQLVLQALIASRQVNTVFEIGTFNGATTRLLAECLPPDGRVTTVDLPIDRFDQTQSPSGFAGADVGRAFRGTTAEKKIEQLRADSLSLDVSDRRGQYDLVLVDGAHDYTHGVADSRLALQLVAPTGIVLWDDFTPYWHGLVRGIVETVGPTGQLRRLSGTALAACEPSRAMGRD